MVLIRRTQNPQAYITAGLVFFLIAIFFSMLADGRLVGRVLADQLSGRVLETLQGFSDGFSLPMFMASIYFQLRGLMLQRGPA